MGSAGGYIEADGTYVDLNGYSKRGQNTTILFDGYEHDATTPHEVLHSMGLNHTFESKDVIPTGMTSTNAPNGTYTFRFDTTDNILDYSHFSGVSRKSLMEWQWEIIRRTSQPET